MWGTEACDGEVTCVEAGFYGSALVCNNCNIDTRSCEVCGPDARHCETLETTASSPSIATNDSQIAVAQGPRVRWFDGELREVATRTFGSRATVTTVSGGWLVVADHPPTLDFVDEAFVIRSSVPLPSSSLHFLSPVVNGHVLVAWRDTESSRIVGLIASEQGTIEVPEVQIGGGDTVDDVTTDGTNFLVATGGYLTKVTPTGTTTRSLINSSGGLSLRSLVTWNGSGGVFAIVSWNTPSTILTRFDAAGAPVGDTVIVPMEVIDMIPDGANVLALVDGKVTLTTIDPTTGTTTPGKELGAGRGHRTLARFGADVVVAWNRDIFDLRHYLAITAP